MKKILLSLCLLAPALLGSISSEAAQVSSVRYLMRYDSTTCKYDVLMYLETGDINPGGSTQKMYTNQLTIVVPHGSNVGGNGGSPAGTITTTPYEPQIGHVSGGVVTRTTAVSWAPTNQNFDPSLPSALSGSDVYAFIASPSSAFFPAATQGDTLLLFKIAITTPTNNCGQGIRIWENNAIKGVLVSGDPTSLAFSLFGGKDYNNAMSIGSSNQIFNGTGTTNMDEAKPNVTSSVTPVTIVTGGGKSTTITGASSAVTSSCYTISSYAWTGPSSGGPTAFTASTSGFSRTNAISSDFGTYTLTVTNSLGCSTVQQHDIITALPVHLLSFDGYASGCLARLSWQVAAGQLDLQAFDVQYSPDGARFETVGHLERNPSSDNYSYSYAQAAGKGFYRLMIIERSGATELSRTVSVATACDAPQITIAPNPTNARSVVSCIEAGDQVKVSDVLGNVSANDISGGTTAAVDLGIYPPGIYTVIVSRNSQILKTDKLTKQ